MNSGEQARETRAANWRGAAGHVGRSALLAIVSGATALGYQVVWTRLFRETFGVTWQASAAVVAAFLGGLAIGAWLLGPVADRRANRLRLYAQLELGVGLAVALGVLLLSAVEPLHLAAARRWHDWPGLLMTARLALAAVVILPATICMGGTLPALVTSALGERHDYGRSVAVLYAANTFGAICGVLVTSFYLLSARGVHGTLAITLLVNLGLVAVAWVASLDGRAYQGSIAEDSTRIADPGTAAMLARRRWWNGTQRPAVDVQSALGLGAVAIAGFVALALQMLWMRMIVPRTGASAYAFALVVATFLTGIVLGSLLLSVLGQRWRDDRFAYGLTQVMLALAIWSTLPLLDGWRGVDETGVVSSSGVDDAGAADLGITAGHAAMTLAGWWRACGWCFAVMLPPATLMGMALPLAARWYERRGGKPGESVGRVWGAAATGNVLGSLAAGFGLVAALGLRPAVLLCALLSCLTGLWGLTSPGASTATDQRSDPHQPASKSRVSPSISRVLLGGVTAAAVAMLIVVSWSRLSGRPLTGTVPVSGSRLVFYEEGPVDTVAVIEGSAAPARRMMVIDGVVVGQNDVELDEKQQMLAHLPMLIAGDRTPRTAVTIGLGTGITAGELARHESLERIWAVELSPTVIRAAEEFRAWNGEVLNHPRVTIERDDGLFFLKRLQEPVDVIVSDGKSVHTSAGNSVFFSSEFYELCRRRLTPDGTFIQWVPTSTPASQLATIRATLRESFDYVYLWCEPPFSLYWVARTSQLEWNQSAVARMLDGQSFTGLRRHGWRDPYSLISLLVADAPILGATLPEVPLNSLERPRLEFFQSGDFANPAAARVMENLRWVQGLDKFELRDVSITGADPETLDCFRRFNRHLLEFCLLIIDPQGDVAAGAERLARVAEVDCLVDGHAVAGRLAGPICLEQGVAEHLRGESESAVTWYLLGARLAPHDPALIRNLTLGSAQLARFGEVVRWGRRAVELEPNDAQLRLEYGIALLAVGRAAEAVPQLELALRLDPNSEDARRAIELARARM